MTTRKNRKSSAPARKNMRLLDINGRIFLRLFEGGGFTDHELSSYCLALLVSDGAQIMGSIYRQETAD
jgi:hypothetical protein